jgi:hypothetical protein
MDSNGSGQFKRSQMTSPANTIIFAEEAEDFFSWTSGKYAIARHFGGGNFVLGDGHAEWIKYDDFCRECPASPGDEADSTGTGDWKPSKKYHWFPYRNAPI